MENLWSTDDLLFVRTQFGDQRAWRTACAAIGEPEDAEDTYHPAYSYGLKYIDDAAYEGASVSQLLAHTENGYCPSILAMIDGVTLASPDTPVLLVDVNHRNGQYGRTMRVAAAHLPLVEVNIGTGNMDFFEFADCVDTDGVFRGFVRS